ncbi:MAG: hypothetical protein DRG59_01395 [Deltaproteobacteria bacterium]|nr:MAG: hypothetical protein DRG59_01395 [Deltaproteobacteria bacterium]
MWKHLPLAGTIKNVFLLYTHFVLSTRLFAFIRGPISFYMKVPYSAKPILSQELSLFVVAGHIESSNAG